MCVCEHSLRRHRLLPRCSMDGCCCCCCCCSFTLLSLIERRHSLTPVCMCCALNVSSIVRAAAVVVVVGVLRMSADIIASGRPRPRPRARARAARRTSCRNERNVIVLCALCSGRAAADCRWAGKMIDGSLATADASDEACCCFFLVAELS